VSGPERGQEIDVLDALEEKWRTEPADLAEWANRAMRTLNLARMWRRNSEEWERAARKEQP
jgi:hypothetical protein